MATPHAPSDQPHGDAPGEDDVAVVGGGIAGMTCALRLAQRGYQVTLYESAPMLGGNASSEPGSGGIYYDVYPHLYCDWYANFWKNSRRRSGHGAAGVFRAPDRHQDIG